jgi:hypothetical protein
MTGPRNKMPPDNPENAPVESILDIMDEEIASAKDNPRLRHPSDEMDLLVADLLKYLSADTDEF